MKGKAIWRHARVSPRKARLVAAAVQGKQVPQALAELEFMGKRAGQLLSKVIRSATANATRDGSVHAGELYISKITADGGPSWKRWMAVPMGRATRVLKRTSHLAVELDVKRPAGKEESKARA
ncbi:MAG: 50S ribosomal protein L22 [Candidatus Omnitrophica bacterium]|nr:50S ribosomal protein L22 [Candidatus Omnitrophota bacterium]